MGSPVYHNQPLETYGRVGGPPDGAPGARWRPDTFPWIFCMNYEAAVAPVGYQESREMKEEEVAKEDGGRERAGNSYTAPPMMALQEPSLGRRL